jgi:hypothetical protein
LKSTPVRDAIVGVVIFGSVAVALTWIFSANGLALRSVFGPAHEQVRRETFEQSKAYRDGLVQELRSLQFEYLKAPAELQPALASVIRHKASGIDAATLPADLRAFLSTLN